MGQNQAEIESEVYKIIKEQQQKIVEARRRKREEENAPLCKLCIPNPITTKQNSPLINP